MFRPNPSVMCHKQFCDTKEGPMVNGVNTMIDRFRFEPGRSTGTYRAPRGGRPIKTVRHSGIFCVYLSA